VTNSFRANHDWLACMAAVIDITGDFGCKSASALLLNCLLSRADVKPSVKRYKCLAIAPNPVRKGCQQTYKIKGWQSDSNNSSKLQLWLYPCA
jgi:hypothetical protein